MNKSVITTGRQGFTLVEILLAMGLLTVVVTAASTMLYSTYKGARKSAAVAVAKGEGAYAIRAMGNMISFATGISCGASGTSTSLVVTLLDGEQVTYSLSAPGGQISSSSGSQPIQYLTSTNVAVSPCGGRVFSCDVSNAPALPRTVSICFQINKANSVDVTDSAGTSGITFETQATLKNYGN